MIEPVQIEFKTLRVEANSRYVKNMYLYNAILTHIDWMNVSNSPVKNIGFEIATLSDKQLVK